MNRRIMKSISSIVLFVVLIASIALVSGYTITGKVIEISPTNIVIMDSPTGYVISDGGGGGIVATTLALYPDQFFDEGVLDVQIVVGEKAPTSDVVAAINIAADLQQTADENTVTPIQVGLAVLDINAKDPSTMNTISVGNPCFNSVSDDLMGYPELCLQDFEPGKGKIMLFNENGFVQLLVAGYDAQETLASAYILADHEDFDLQGLECETIVPDLNTLSVNCPPLGPFCSDSDEGKVYYEKGTVELGEDLKTDSCVFCTGACQPGTACEVTCGGVREYYCSNNQINFEDHVCPNGCEDGACIVLPDLTVTGFSYELLGLGSTDDIMISFYIENIGKTQIDNDFVLVVTNPTTDKVLKQETYSKNYFQPGYKAHILIAGDFGEEFVQGKNVIEIVVDKYDSVKESNENNNFYSETIFGSVAECTDSDGGRNYYVKGQTTGYTPGVGTVYTSVDMCLLDGINKANLQETWCENNEVKVEIYNCLNGCKDGACLQEQECELEFSLIDLETKLFRLGNLEYEITAIIIDDYQKAAKVSLNGYTSKRINVGTSSVLPGAGSTENIEIHVVKTTASTTTTTNVVNLCIKRVNKPEDPGYSCPGIEPVRDILRSEETKTYTIDMRDYEVSAIYLDNIGKTAKLSINGLLTKQVYEGQSEELPDEIFVKVHEVMGSQKDEIVDFCLSKLSIEADCSESDGGLNLLVYGKCIDKYGDSFSDSCSGNVLTEYYCNIRDICMESKPNCADAYGADYVCRNGACIKENVECYDETDCMVYLNHCTCKYDCGSRLIAIGDCDQECTEPIPEIAPLCSCVNNQCVQHVNHCFNGRKDYDETGIDCGGRDCVLCEQEEPCYSNSDCEYNNFCEFKAGMCKGPGTCVLKPEICTMDYVPVCGCDDKTYGNDCSRRNAGVSLKDRGECEEPVCPPECLNVGTRSEGWYDSCTGKLVKYAQCVCTSVCKGGVGEYGTIQEQGYYSSCTGELILRAKCSQGIKEEPIEIYIGKKAIEIKQDLVRGVVIIQSQERATTRETLEISEGSIGISTDVGVKKVNYLPEEAKQIALRNTKMHRVTGIELIEENNKPVYELTGKTREYILWIFPVSRDGSVKIDAGTNEVIQ